MDQFLIKHSPNDSYLRNQNKEDVTYRKKQKMTFHKRLKDVYPDCKFCFHGTPIWNAEKIISSGNISAQVQSISETTKSGDKNCFSVTTVDNLWFTTRDYADLWNYNYPAGCIFVIEPKGEKEFEIAQKTNLIENINFESDAKRIVNIITTPENIEKINSLISKSNFNFKENIVCDYEEFLSRCSKIENLNENNLRTI